MEMPQLDWAKATRSFVLSAADKGDAGASANAMTTAKAILVTGAIFIMCKGHLIRSWR